MKITHTLLATSALFTFGIIATVTTKTEAATKAVPVYRLYNHNTGEHFYTESSAEEQNLVSHNWTSEGIGWYSATSGTPVYRVYNPNAKGGDHYYTESKYEAQTLVNKGWKWDNNAKPVFYSAGNVNLYVAYNPNAQSGAHNYTTSTAEQSNLLHLGWKYGTVAWKVEGTSTGAGLSQAELAIANYGMSPSAPNQNTVNLLPATPSDGYSAAEIKAMSGISSYEGVPNRAGSEANSSVARLFGLGCADLSSSSSGQEAYVALNSNFYSFATNSGEVTAKEWDAVVDYFGYPQSWKNVVIY